MNCSSSQPQFSAINLDGLKKANGKLIVSPKLHPKTGDTVYRIIQPKGGPVNDGGRLQQRYQADAFVLTAPDQIELQQANTEVTLDFRPSTRVNKSANQWAQVKDGVFRRGNTKNGRRGHHLYIQA